MLAELVIFQKSFFATEGTEKKEAHLQVYGKGLTRKAQIRQILAKLNKKFALFATFVLKVF